jgi:uncharacterized protein (DUF736 family)
MSATYNNQIEIVVFDNNNRSNEKAPVKTGKVTFPDGTTYEVALWDRVSKTGNPFLSGTLKLPDMNRQSQAPRRQYQPKPQAPRNSVEIDF